MDSPTDFCTTDIISHDMAETEPIPIERLGPTTSHFEDCPTEIIQGVINAPAASYPEQSRLQQANFANILDRHDLYSLTLVCRELHHQTNSILWERNKREDQSSAVTWAAANGNIETLEKAVYFGLDFQNPSPCSALCTAAYNGQNLAIDWLLAHGHDINRADNNICPCGKTSTPVHAAMCGRRSSTAIKLLERGASLTYQNPGFTYNFIKDFYAGPELGWSAYVRPSPPGHGGAHPEGWDQQVHIMYEAIGSSGMTDVVNYIVKNYPLARVEPGNTSFNGNMFLLHAASFKGYTQVIDWVLDAGYDIDQELCGMGDHEWTLRNPYPRFAGLVYPALVPTTALQVAVCRRRASFAIALVSRGASLEFGTMSDDTNSPVKPRNIVTDAIRHGLTELLEYLIANRGLDIHRPDLCALHVAALFNQKECIAWLLDKGADVNQEVAVVDLSRDQYCRWSLQCSDPWDITTVFPNEWPNIMTAPLYVALCKGSSSCSTYLISKGATLEYVDYEASNPFINGQPKTTHAAVTAARHSNHYPSNLTVLEYLVKERGVDLRHPDITRFGNLIDPSELFYDTECPILRKLLDLGMDPNGNGQSWYDSYLHHALTNAYDSAPRYGTCAQMLLEAGARFDRHYVPRNATEPWNPAPIQSLLTFDPLALSYCDGLPYRWEDERRHHIINGRLEMLNTLIDRGADVNLEACGYRRFCVSRWVPRWHLQLGDATPAPTPLECALAQGTPQEIVRLIEAGAKVTKCPLKRRYYLGILVRSAKDVDLVARACDYHHHRTPLEGALASGTASDTAQLITAGAGAQMNLDHLNEIRRRLRGKAKWNCEDVFTESEKGKWVHVSNDLPSDLNPLPAALFTHLAEPGNDSLGLSKDTLRWALNWKPVAFIFYAWMQRPYSQIATQNSLADAILQCSAQHHITAEHFEGVLMQRSCEACEDDHYFCRALLNITIVFVEGMGVVYDDWVVGTTWKWVAGKLQSDDHMPDLERDSTWSDTEELDVQEFYGSNQAAPDSDAV